MRAILPLLIALAVTGTLAAQTDVPPDQCLGGRLLTVQQGSITLQFNDRVTTVPITPGAEIWRHGVDLESIRQLVSGDDINLKCVRTEPGGPVMATMVAVPEGNDTLTLEPHHITAGGVCLGKLVAVARDSVTVRNDDGPCKVQTNAQTTFWRGENFPDATALKLGDEAGVRYKVGYPGRVLTAESVEANVAKFEGTVVGARPGLIVVDGGKGQLSAALEALREQGVDVPVIGLAKQREEVFVPGRSAPLELPAADPASLLLQRIRDEAHRFAVTFHRQRRGTDLRRASIFDELPKVGPVRRRAILEHFGSPERFIAASRDELEQVPGLPRRVAREIYGQLHKAG